MQWCQHLEADYGIDPQVWQSLDGPSFPLSSKLCLCNSFHGCFFPILRRGRQSVHTLVFILLEFHVFCKLYFGYSKFLGLYPLISEYVSYELFCDLVTSLRMLFSRSILLSKNFTHPKEAQLQGALTNQDQRISGSWSHQYSWIPETALCPGALTHPESQDLRVPETDRF